MKTQETKSAQMDDIVFEHRNKSYGAYILRKMYNKQLNKALLLSIAILVAGLAYPVVSSYTGEKGGKYIWNDTGFEVMPTDPPRDVVTPPPPPPPISEKTRQIVFLPPEVVVRDVEDEIGMISMDDINNLSTNEQVEMPIEKPTEKKEEVIADPEKVPPLLIVEEMPSFTGGDNERLRYLSTNINYPQLAAENGIQGTVYIQFIVDSKGNISDVKVLRGIGGGCDEEALRVIKAMPKWNPGKQNGKTVRVLFNMPIVFKLAI